MPLVQQHQARIRDAHRPRRHHVAPVAAIDGEVALRQRQLFARPFDFRTHFENFSLMNRDGIHQDLPRLRWVLSVIRPIQNWVVGAGMKHVVKRHIVQMFSRHLNHAWRPTIVTPADELH